MLKNNNALHFRVQAIVDHSYNRLLILNQALATTKSPGHSYNLISKLSQIVRALLLKLTPRALRNSNLLLIALMHEIWKSQVQAIVIYLLSIDYYNTTLSLSPRRKSNSQRSIHESNII